MKNIIKKGIIVVGIYLIFTAYILMASDRIERLDRKDSNELINVSLKFSE